MENVNWQINKSSSECHKYILEHEVDCDISFKVGDDKEVIKAHKLILSARSPVFDRMFKGPFCEAETDPVIPDVSPEAFRTLLRYCYYECLDIEGDVALLVLYAATKYMLPILARAARKTSIEKLDSSKIWEACKYSTGVDDEELYGGCITYLKGNLSEMNILEVMRYAVSIGDEELNTYCRKHLQRKLSVSNILDVVRYVVSIGDEELHGTCTHFLKKHLCGSNIWEMYKYALNEGDAAVHQCCKEYFERDIPLVREALQSEDFLNIQFEVLFDVLHINDKVDKAVGIGKSPGISISEIELFTACNQWAEAECLRQRIESTGTMKKKVLGECLSLIRFPTMLQKDLMTVVFPTGIFTQKDIVNLGQYMYREPGSECQVDFPSKKRQFVVIPHGPAFHNSASAVLIKSEHRVVLSRLWTIKAGNYTVTVMDEESKRSWSKTIDTEHENHVTADGNEILHYFDIAPQVLEAGTRYTVTAAYHNYFTTRTQQKGLEYIKIKGRPSPYNKLSITRGHNTGDTIFCLTLYLI